MRKWHPFHKLRGRLLGIQNDLQLGLTTDEALDQRLGQLWKDLQANKPIHELAQMEGWVMLDAYLSKQLASIVKGLPEKILQGKNTEAVADAAYIKAANDILGLVNRTLYDTKLCGDFVESMVAMSRKLEEKRNAR